MYSGVLESRPNSDQRPPTSSEDGHESRFDTRRSKRFKKLWQMFGVPETIKLETVAARCHLGVL